MPRSNMDHRTDRRAFLARAGLAAAGLALAPGLTRSPGRTTRGPGASYLDWGELRGGVFATTSLSTGGNCLVAAGSDGALLVDTKFPLYAGQLRRDGRELTGRELAYIVNTHHHADHTSGNLAFTGLPVIARGEAVGRIAGQHRRNLQSVSQARSQIERLPEGERAPVRADLEAYRERMDDLTPDAWTPDTALEAPRSGVDLGGRWIEFVHFGRKAHTDNDLVIALPGENVVHTGDLVFNGLFPYFDPEGGASAAGWIETLRGVADLCDDETIVVPGHGPITDAGGVRSQLDYLERLREAVGREVEAGTPVEEVKSRTWPFMEGLGFERARAGGIEFVYREIAGEG